MDKCEEMHSIIGPLAIGITWPLIEKNAILTPRDRTDILLISWYAATEATDTAPEEKAALLCVLRVVLGYDGADLKSVSRVLSKTQPMKDAIGYDGLPGLLASYRKIEGASTYVWEEDDKK
ncbi:hypothetical protein FACS189449_06210 [Alphaproteobacteria bacterium]|nr:hypothetical protein FACS189449_06210 [Alphaproteobacteria bacterium]